MNMGRGESGRKKDKATEPMSLSQKKEKADAEEIVVRKDLEDYKSWTTKVERMHAEGLMEYVKHKQDFEGEKKTAPKKRNRKPKPPSPHSPLMAAVLKHHRG